ncbi:sensor histidine kinase [Aliamphritea hakodatensis]|uniref:sensor histidine kinase n=1 Tax=Aliamphritea hakodatensis TaxID=2895352 RepID=UPI0022FD386C|nr:PAS domain-containing sensor histidine kinase [Aliamphritea hakodatensis]
MNSEPLAYTLFFGLQFFSLCSLLLTHFLRNRITLGPLLALAASLIIAMWYMRYVGWWINLPSPVEAPLTAIIPSIFLMTTIIYMIDGGRTYWATVYTLVMASTLGWLLSEYGQLLSDIISMGHVLELATRTHTAALAAFIIALLCCGLFANYLLNRAPVWFLLTTSGITSGLIYFGLSGIFESGFDIGSNKFAVEYRAYLLSFVVPLLIMTPYLMYCVAKGGHIPGKSLRRFFAIIGNISSDNDIDSIVHAREMISELKQLNQSLIQAQRINKYQIQHSHIGTVFTDYDGYIEQVNPAIADIFESDTDFSGKSLNKLLPELTVRDLNRVTLEKSTEIITLKRESRPSLLLEVMVAFRYGFDENPCGYHILLKDVTEAVNQRRRQEVTDAIFTLQRTGRLLVHDIKNLSFAIRSSSAHSREAFEAHDSKSFYASIDTIDLGVERALALVSSLSADNQLGILNISSINLVQLVEETLMLNEAELNLHNIRIQFEHPDEPVLVSGDIGQLSRVLMNLLVNAIRACKDADAPAIRIIIHTYSDDIQIEFTDNGVGLSPDMLDRAFDSGFTSKSDGAGGLGLCISQLITLAHSGDLTLLSDGPGNGATARITLPKLLDNGEFNEFTDGIMLASDNQQWLSHESALLEKVGIDIIEAWSTEEIEAVMSDNIGINTLITTWEDAGNIENYTDMLWVKACPETHLLSLVQGSQKQFELLKKMHHKANMH